MRERFGEETVDNVERTATSEVKGKAPIELRVEYQRLNALLADYLKHWSERETFISTARPLPVGTEFHFVLGTQAGTTSLTLRGRVTHVTRRDETGRERKGEGMKIAFLDDESDGPTGGRDKAMAAFRETLGSHVAERLLLSGAPLAGGTR
ncbi:MAG: hypothetical protein ACO3JL_04925 [Myxococcota bacterium]